MDLSPRVNARGASSPSPPVADRADPGRRGIWAGVRAGCYHATASPKGPPIPRLRSSCPCRVHGPDGHRRSGPPALALPCSCHSCACQTSARRGVRGRGTTAEDPTGELSSWTIRDRSLPPSLGRVPVCRRRCEHALLELAPGSGHLLAEPVDHRDGDRLNVADFSLAPAGRTENSRRRGRPARGPPLRGYSLRRSGSPGSTDEWSPKTSPMCSSAARPSIHPPSAPSTVCLRPHDGHYP